MKSSTKERLARRGDGSAEACGIRLRACRAYLGLSQENLGALVNIGKTAVNNAEKGRSFPSRDLALLLFKEYRIDLNFLGAGEYAQLPNDVLERLFPALAVANEEWEGRRG